MNEVEMIEVELNSDDADRREEVVLKIELEETELEATELEETEYDALEKRARMPVAIEMKHVDLLKVDVELFEAVFLTDHAEVNTEVVISCDAEVTRTLVLTIDVEVSLHVVKDDYNDLEMVESVVVPRTPTLADSLHVRLRAAKMDLNVALVHAAALSSDHL